MLIYRLIVIATPLRSAGQVSAVAQRASVAEIASLAPSPQSGGVLGKALAMMVDR